MLKWRIITALILLPLALGLILFAERAVFTVFLFILLQLALHEWQQFCGFSCQKSRFAYTAIVSLIWLNSGYCVFSYPQLVIPVLAFACLVWLFLGIWVMWQCALKDSIPIPPTFLKILGPVILFCFALGADFLKNNQTLNSTLGNWLLFVCLLIWAADVGAYFSGRRFGGTKLCSTLSPGKTWAGAFGGVICSGVLAVALTSILNLFTLSFVELMIVLVLIIPSSILGDLTESALKRQCGIKDSGNLLPGHGGILDRFDSLFVTVPLFALLKGILS